MNSKVAGQLSGLATRIVAESLMTTEQAIDAQQQASLQKMHFVQYLVEKENVDGLRLARACLTRVWRAPV